MRPINYLQDKASRLNEEHKTLTVIDRAMSEAGLRRKGSGRTIPFPTLREELMLMLAIMGRRTVATAVEDAQNWAELLCMSGRGKYFERRQYRTFIECLEDVCHDISEPGKADQEITDDLLIELDLTRQHGTIAFQNKPQDHLFFLTPGITKGYQAHRLVRISCGFLIHIARH